MGLFTKPFGPIFLKEESDTSYFLSKMEELLQKAEGESKKEIEKQIKLAKYGQLGEQNIAYELRNSGMDMFILHDIYLEVNGLSAQIDYLVVTRGRTFVIECKNLIGTIEINSAGNFIRQYEWNGKKIREGIYSPITQNERHMLVLKELRKANKNFIFRKMFEKNFDINYQSIVVLANPKTYLLDRYAKKEVKNKVIKADQLIQYMKESNKTYDMVFSESEMRELAEQILRCSLPNKSDYSVRYEKLIETMVNGENTIKARLKEFRLNQSRVEKNKPYYIFNDAQLDDLLQKNPSNKEELLQISGFGPVKVEKYGTQILRILNT